MNRKPIPFGLLVHVARRRVPVQSDVVRLLREKKELQAQLLECQSTKLRWSSPVDNVGVRYVSDGIPSEVPYLRGEIARHIQARARLQVENSSLRHQIADLSFQRTMSGNPGPIIHETAAVLPSIRTLRHFIDPQYKDQLVARHGLASRTPRDDLRKAVAAYDQSFDRMMSAMGRYIRYEGHNVRRRVVTSTTWRAFVKAADRFERGFSAGMQRVATFVSRIGGAILWALLFSLILFLVGAAIGLLLASPEPVPLTQMNPSAVDLPQPKPEGSNPADRTLQSAAPSSTEVDPSPAPTQVAPLDPYFEEFSQVSTYNADNIPIWGLSVYPSFIDGQPRIVAFQQGASIPRFYYMSYQNLGSVRVVEHLDDDSCNWNEARPLNGETDSGSEFYPMGVMARDGQVVGVYLTNRRACIANEPLVYPYELR